MNSLVYDARKVIVLIVLGFLIDGSAVSCQGAEAQAKTVAVTVQQLAVMPFVKSTTAAEKRAQKLEKTLDCQFREICSFDDDVLPGTDDAVTRLAQTALRRKIGDTIVPLGQVKDAYSALQKESSETPREIAVRLGQSLGVDHVMVGGVWRYEERVGSAMAASSPASVAFSFFLVDVASQKLVWEGSFRKTQTSLSENFLDTGLFLKKGMKWLTAEELSSYGIDKTLKKLMINSPAHSY
jgi:hypothetical protein